MRQKFCVITHYCGVGSLELLLLPKGYPWSEGHLGLKIDELDHTMQKQGDLRI